MYQQSVINQTLGNAAGNYIEVIPILKFTNWARIFGTDADDEQGKRCVIKSSNMQWNVTSDDPDPVGFSMFAVSLKKTASDILTTAGDLTGLTAGVHYVGNGSKVLLNMNFFNVHYVKRWNSGGSLPGVTRTTAGVSQTSIANEGMSYQKTGKISIPYGKYGMSIQNPAGDWKAGGHPKADTQNYFVLCFTDNSTVDLQNPLLSWNIVHAALVSA